MIHRNLLKDLGSLPAATRKKVSEMVDKFHRDSKTPALHLEPYIEAVDSKVRSARVGDDYRAIVIAPTQGDTYLLMHVDHHDKAYRWCKNKHFEIHQSTGVLQVFDVEEVNAVAEETKPIFQPVSSYPLQKLTDDEIFHAGVPSPLIPAVRVIQSDEALSALREYLPADAYQVLLFVACGMTVDEALSEALGITEDKQMKVADTGDFTNLEEQSDLVFVDGEEELKRIMASSFDAWRIFLHPYQRKIVEWNVAGPMKVNGAAGTGKTVVMMHRAVYLASRLTNPNARILVTTYTSNLTVTIKDLIKKLATQKCPAAADKIEVTNLHALARTICTRGGWRGKVAGKQAMDEIWQDLLESSATNSPMFTPDFIREEYEEVVDPMGITTEDEFLTTVRSGRPRLSRPQRKAVWPMFASFQRELKKRNLLTFDGLIHEARLALDKGDFPHYEHVLVDEIQDFGVEALRLIRMLSPSTEGAMNPLTVVGDGHQRIYKSNIPLSRAGIEVRGRSRRLKINYRTTEQIRTCAQKMLEGVEVDDLDGDSASTVGDQSLVQGPQPTFVKCSGQDEEAIAVVKWVQALLAENYATHEICIAPGKPAIRSALAAANIPTLELQANASDPESSEAGVRLGTLYRIKGLEFKAVALCLTGESTLSNEANSLAAKRQRCLHYVAATRARERLLITS
jgi:superfamily I DNA/RNA helicase/mRNA-degrading endonuclease RelE of RelBE toxin-antitoxin system